MQIRCKIELQFLKKLYYWQNPILPANRLYWWRNTDKTSEAFRRILLPLFGTIVWHEKETRKGDALKEIFFYSFSSVTFSKVPRGASEFTGKRVAQMSRSSL